MAVGAGQSGGGAARAIRCMPGDGLDIRVILSSGEAQRRWRGALEYPLPQFFPRLEVGNPFPCDGYRLTGLRIAGLAGRAVVDGETSEAADFDAVAMNQGSMHGPEAPMILTDNETRVDLLNNEAIATTIIELLRAKPDHPVTIGVHGDWGAGKSSVLEMIEAGFADKDDVLCLKFNGWRFQGFEDAKIALIEGIVTGLVEKRPALNKAAAAVKDVFRRIDWLKVAKRAGGLALTAFTGIPTPDQIGAIVGSLEAVMATLPSSPRKKTSRRRSTR
jgi:hypothetical protein